MASKGKRTKNKTCVLCCKPIVEGKEEALMCKGEICSNKWMHRYCAGVLTTHYKLLEESPEPFCCYLCVQLKHAALVEEMKSTIASLTTEVVELRATLESEATHRSPSRQVQTSEPTRVVNSTSTLIDLAFVSTRRMVQFCETIPPLANSDHLGIYLHLSNKLCKNIQKPQTRKIWQYNLADFDQAVELLEAIEWEHLLNDSDPSLYWSAWKHYFLQIMDIFIPHITVNTKKFGNIPWINNEIKKAMKKRNTLY